MDKEIVMWILGGLIVVIGWFASRKIAELEKSDGIHIGEINALKDANAQLKIFIAEQHYVKHSDLTDMFAKLDEKLEKIFDKLNLKADK